MEASPSGLSHDGVGGSGGSSDSPSVSLVGKVPLQGEVALPGFEVPFV